jgi:hypothetical protein
LALTGWYGSYEEAIRKDISNPRRQELALCLSQAASETGNPEAQAWGETQQEAIIRSLNRASISEVDWLLGLGTTHDADFLREMWVSFLCSRLGSEPHYYFLKHQRLSTT